MTSLQIERRNLETYTRIYELMIFEGTEKKVEIMVASEGKSLRSLGPSFWSEIVRAANARILSSASTDELDAYLLSESSLFVYDDRIVMITCGRTNLAHATGTFIDRIGAPRVDYLVYERKNENFPHLQPTSFEDDILEIAQRIPGNSIHFGERNEHYLSLFASSAEFTPLPNDTTIEVLMYDLAPDVRKSFQGQSMISLDLDEIFPGYEIDDHVFSPCGYSLNGLKDSCYYTIHVTPEEHGSYASFESNICISSQNPEKLIRTVTDLFRPERFDVIIFDAPGSREDYICIEDYSVFLTDRKDIGSSYNVQFLHFRKIRERAIQNPV
jgi:S-adenosylmethionine decarboxylase